MYVEIVNLGMTLIRNCMGHFLFLNYCKFVICLETSVLQHIPQHWTLITILFCAWWSTAISTMMSNQHWPSWREICHIYSFYSCNSCKWVPGVSLIFMIYLTPGTHLHTTNMWIIWDIRCSNLYCMYGKGWWPIKLMPVFIASIILNTITLVFGELSQLKFNSV